MSSNVHDTTTYELADVGTRLIAIIIDGIILSVIGSILFGATGHVWTGGVGAFVVGVVYNWYFWTRQDGQTPGKKLMKIRVVKADGSPMQDADAVVRYVGYYINSIIFGIGWLWALIDSKHQGWHDMLAKTYVVRADDKLKNDFKF